MASRVGGRLGIDATVARATSRGAALVAALLAGGCLGGSDAPPQRFFRPPEGSVTAWDGATSSLSVRLEAFTAAGHLTEEVAWQDNAVEYGYYSDRIWTERPVQYVEEALVAELYLRRGLNLSSPPTVHLDVDLLAFEEVRRPRHEALVRVLAAARQPDHQRVRSRRFEARRPLADEDPTTLVTALGDALQQVVREVADFAMETGGA